MAVWKDGKCEIIQNDQGHNITPSVVAYIDDERLVGDPGKRQMIRHPKNTIYDSKRLIGRNFNDPTVVEDRKLWAFDVKEGPNKKPLI